jgi:hypothetical protein
MGETMTDQDIRDYYDRNWDVDIRQLSRLTGKTPREIKRILMEENK